MMGVCGCVTGPPPGGICNACGAVGPGYAPPGMPNPPVYQRGFYEAPALTEEQVRRIIREELERASHLKGDKS